MQPNPQRDEILRRLRIATANPALAADRQAEPASAPTPPTHAPSDDLAATWRREFSALGGQVYGPLAPAGAVGQACDLLRQRGFQQILAWDDEEIALPGLDQALAAAGVAVMRPRGHSDHGALDHIAVGVSGAAAGLADTGSLIVTSGPGRPRSASLVPPVHLAFLPISRIYPDLPAWMAQQGAGLLPQTANLVIITGPSRTADIELTLVVGVHGPGEIHVILVEASCATGQAPRCRSAA